MDIRQIIREELHKVFEGVGNDYYNRYPDFLDPQFNPQIGHYPPVGMHVYGNMVKEQEMEGEMVDRVAEELKPYRFYLLCDKLCDLKGVEVKNQMIADSAPVSKDELIDKCAFSESLMEYETMSADPSMGFYKSEVDGVPCYYIQYAGFEFIFTLDNPSPNEYWVDEMFDEEGNYIY